MSDDFGLGMFIKGLTILAVVGLVVSFGLGSYIVYSKMKAPDVSQCVCPKGAP